jgi:predicted AAA+ superfamily ATPase
MWIERSLEKNILEQSTFKPILLISGARQSGKSSLLKKLFPMAEYISFDRQNVAEAAEANPEQFLRSIKRPVIFDEIQYVPKLFRDLKIAVDNERDKNAQFFLTGSQKFSLMKSVSESLAGRISVFELDTLSAEELRRANLETDHTVQRGGFPELWAKKGQSSLRFYDDYLVTYLERDLKAIIEVSSLRLFDKFLRILALRVGSLVNYNEIAKDLGASPNTVKSWIHALEVSGLVHTLAPFFSNETKRLIKTPKIYFRDNGLLCHLLRIHNPSEWSTHAFAGAIWENFVFTELFKELAASYTTRALYFWREKSGFEIDFVVDRGSTMQLIECKLNERIDRQSLNFSHFYKIHNKHLTESYVACLIKETKKIPSFESISLFNPLYCKF